MDIKNKKNRAIISLILIFFALLGLILLIVFDVKKAINIYLISSFALVFFNLFITIKDLKNGY